MRISDCSSDVCTSDLRLSDRGGGHRDRAPTGRGKDLPVGHHHQLDGFGAVAQPVIRECSMRAPVHLRYSPDHEWVASGATARIGITAYAADALGDIVFVDLPAVGQRVSSGQACAETGSTKSVRDIV